MDYISHDNLREVFANFILNNRTSQQKIRTMAEFAGGCDGLRDLSDCYDKGTLIAECKKIREDQC